jgi:oligopeptide transport system substrate-binding protein
MKTSALLSLVFAIFVLAGCARRETAVEEGIRTKTLLVGNAAEPASLDPHLAGSIVDSNILMALFEGLTALDEKTSTAVPAAADRWDVSADGLVYTFHLRPNARWSSGDPVTAADFAFAFRRILLPAMAAHYSYMLWPIRNAQAFNEGRITDFSAVGVEVVDAATLRLTLEHPAPYLPVLAAHSTWLPVHRATLEKFRAVADRTAPWAVPGKLVGNGPFTLEEWQANVRVVVKKEPLYWDAANTRLERIVFFPTERSEIEERNFRAGQVHVTYQLPPTKIGPYRERHPLLLRMDPFASTMFLRFNVTRKPLDNPKVRRALSLAIDRRAIVERIFANSRSPATHFIPPDLAGYTARTRVPTDFETARHLLAEAGFPEGRGLPVFEIQSPNTAEFSKMAEIIQEQWRRELGVHATIAVEEWKVLLQNERNLDYMVTNGGGWVADFADPTNFFDVFLANGGNNWTGWGSSEYDRLLADASRALDPAHRFECFQQAEALLLDEAPIAPLYFDASAYLIHPAVKGWAPAPLYLRRFQKVWLENSR